jgi:hypothetical protein
MSAEDYDEDYKDREPALDERLLRGDLSAEEHAREAEWLLGAIGSSWYSPDEDDLTRAQVHATLAVARALLETRRPEAPPVVPR